MQPESPLSCADLIKMTHMDAPLGLCLKKTIIDIMENEYKTYGETSCHIPEWYAFLKNRAYPKIRRTFYLGIVPG